MAAVVAAVTISGCGADSAVEPPTASQPVQHPTTSVAVDDRSSAGDGVVSPDEAARATELVRADAIGSELFGRYGGVLTSWEPSELEGEPRGAAAWIEFADPVAMSPKVIRVGSVPPPDRVEDYVLERDELSDETVGRYGVVVDLRTMTIVWLAPSPAPPATVASPTE